jgi:DNA (cytosine-5)-methyltransferase 1
MPDRLVTEDIAPARFNPATPHLRYLALQVPGATYRATKAEAFQDVKDHYGDVDEEGAEIAEQPVDDEIVIGSLFSGYGGLDLGVMSVLGGRVAWHVEFDANPSRVLEHNFPGVPNYGDVTKVDWASVEPVDILTGGFPCQDVSLAGARRGLREGTRSGLWTAYAEAIDALRPALVVIENVRGLLSADGEPWHDELTEADNERQRIASLIRLADTFIDGNPSNRKEGRSAYATKWRGARVRLTRQHKRAVSRFNRERGLVRRAIDTVLRDLAGLGFDAEWCGVRAADAGAPHGRFRVFIVAYPQHDGDAPGQGGRSAREVIASRRSEWIAQIADRESAGAGRGGAGEREGSADADRDGLEAVRRGGRLVEPDADGCVAAGTHAADAVGVERAGEPAKQPRRALAARGSGVTAPDTAGDGRPGRHAPAGPAEESGQPGDAADAHARAGGECPAAGHADGERLEGRAVSAERADERPVGADGLGPESVGRVDADPEGRGRGLRASEDFGSTTGDVDPSGDEAGVHDRSEVGRETGERPLLDWGPYRAAVQRWERVVGRLAPAPTRPDGKNNGHRLSPLLVEWMMGLLEGWVTDPTIWVGMSESAARNAQLKALGNGVVPQQAALALTVLLARVPGWLREQFGLAA